MMSMEERWSATGLQWLVDNPVMEPPPGFRLDPLAVGPTRGEDGEDDGSGWFLRGVEPEEVTDHHFADVGPARSLVESLAHNDPDVHRIELWEGKNCVWAAVRTT